MYIDVRDKLLGNWTEIAVSVWEQHRYDAPLASKQASHGHEQQPPVVFGKLCTIEMPEDQA